MNNRCHAPVAVVLAYAALGIAGCRSPHPGHEGMLVEGYQVGENALRGQDRVRQTTWGAEYVLYGWSRKAAADAEPDATSPEIFSRELVPKEDIGFRTSEGTLAAIAGDEEFHLDDIEGRYCWHMRPGTGPSSARLFFSYGGKIAFFAFLYPIAPFIWL